MDQLQLILNQLVKLTKDGETDPIIVVFEVLRSKDEIGRYS